MVDLNPAELLNDKLLLIKDLQKNLKISYKAQYRNITLNLKVNTKKYVKKRTIYNITEHLHKYHALNVNLTNYLLNLFDVFGGNAVLNAKKLFEENAVKWAKKLQKKYPDFRKLPELNLFITNFYMEIPENDYIVLQDEKVYWYFKCPQNALMLEDTNLRYNKLYDIKHLWLSTFINNFVLNCTVNFDIVKNEPEEIVTEIIIKAEE